MEPKYNLRTNVKRDKFLSTCLNVDVWQDTMYNTLIFLAPFELNEEYINRVTNYLQKEGFLDGLRKIGQPFKVK